MSPRVRQRGFCEEEPPETRAVVTQTHHADKDTPEGLALCLLPRVTGMGHGVAMAVHLLSFAFFFPRSWMSCLLTSDSKVLPNFTW